MSFADDYYNELDRLSGNKKKKKKEEEQPLSGNKGVTGGNDYATAYWDAINDQRHFAPSSDYIKPKTFMKDDDEDIAPVKNTVETTQEIYDKWGKYYHESDYDKYSKMGADIKNPTMTEARGWLTIAGKAIGGKEVGNKVTFSRDNADDLLLSELDGGVGYKDWKWTYSHMTDFEVGIYNYLLAKNGKDAAQEFLDDIEETLNARQGGKTAEYIQSIDNDALKAVNYGVASVGSGVESAGIGLRQLFSEEAIPTTSTEVANQILLEGLDGWKKDLYQAGNTVGNMLPSVAVGFMNPLAGQIIQSSSSAGNSYRQALNEGKTKEEAAAYGVMVGSLEFVTSKLLGGVAGMTGDLPKKALSKIATFENGLLRFGAKYGINLASEVTEEELQLWLEPIARKIAFGEEYDAPTLEEMAETAIVTAISTGILNSSTDIATGNLTKVDGLSVHEAKVIEAEVEKRVSEQEVDGKKLTNKEKDKIREAVITDMSNGQLDIGTIESVLGGKTYAEYKSLTEQEDSLNAQKKGIEDEISSLVKTPETQFTVEQREKLTSLREEAKGIKEKIKALDSKGLKSRLSDEVFGIAKNTRLAETYAERARKGQAFEADLSQYKGKQREAVERAIKSGVLNNTYRAHELVDVLSKIEADKGIVFDYTNNEKLKESGFAVEGKVVNGYVKDGGVTLNVQSAKAWQSTVGHEIAHVLEGTESYSALREALYAHAESKGELASRKAALTELYKDMDADIDAELTADLVGDYLFTDKDFINKLTGNQTLFQKVWDEVKYLCKVATGKELTEIEKIEREFAKAWKTFSDEGVDEAASEADDSSEGNVKYSLSANAKTELHKALYDTGHQGEIRLRDETPSIMTSQKGVKNLPMTMKVSHIRENVFSEEEARKLGLTVDKHTHYHGLGEVFFLQVVDGLDNVTEAYRGTKSAADPSRREDYFLLISEFKDKDGNIINVPVYINEHALYNRAFIDVNKISTVFGKEGFRDYINRQIRDKNLVRIKNKSIQASESKALIAEDYGMNASTDDSISQNSENVNTKFSLSSDSDYMSAVDRGDTEMAQKMVDEAAKKSGYTIRAYHGTNADFSTFDKNRVGKGNDQYGAGFYFATDKEAATHYGSRVINSALKIENPFVISSTNLLNAEITFTDEQAYEIVKRHPMMYDTEESPLGDYYDSYWENGVEDWMIEDLAMRYTDLGYLDSDLFRNYPNELHEAVRDVTGHDGVVVNLQNGEKFYVAWFDNQMKATDPVTYDDSGNVIPLSQRFNEKDNDIRYSLSGEGEQFAPIGNYSTPLNETALDAPTVSTNTPTAQTNTPTAQTNTPSAVKSAGTAKVAEAYPDDYAPITAEEAEAMNKGYADSLTDADAPPEVDAPYYGDTETVADDPFDERDMKAVGNQKVKAYMYENPEVKPFFQEAALYMLGDLRNSTKGERWYDDKAYYETNGEKGFGGTKRHTTADIAYLLDEFGYTYEEIEKGLNAIIEDNGKENNACSKRIEFMLNDRLLNGYNSLDAEIPYNQEYRNLIREKQITEYNEEAAKRFFESADVDAYVPAEIDEDIAPVAPTTETPMLENIPVLPDEELEQGTYAAIKPKPVKQPSLKKVNNAESNEHIAQVLTEEPRTENKKQGIFSKAIANFIDKGAAVENLSIKTKNRALQDKYKSIGRSETKAQYFMENGTKTVKALNDIRAEVEKTGRVQDFYNYIYHKHNIDRMNLESKERPNLKRLTAEMRKLKLLNLQDNQLRAIASEKITKETAPKRAELIKIVQEYLASKDVKNKPVFDYSVTSEMSQGLVNEYETNNPEFKEYAKDVYDYMNHLRQMMVDEGVISQETADLWAKMYPYYVPIRRSGHMGEAVSVPLDTNKTGINAPIKGATGGNSDILPLFETMAQRTMQTFKAIDKNRFGVELKNTLGNVVESTKTSIDEVIDGIDTHEDLLQEGKNGKNPTFTVFENGERVTFEITEELYDAMKPTSEGLMHTNKVLNTASNLHRGVLTEYSVPFMVTNAIKDAQDVLINSQHPARTYANFPTAVKELTTKGKWYAEYMENGGGDNTYFDKQTNTFNKEKSRLRKILGFPLDKISDANNFIEKVPRLAEYIASRKKGASVDAAMLDAARVTTDFSAGGDVTKFLNRNGATFLNASVQGFAQQVRNVREAKMNGLKGWLGLATKFAVAGLPAMLLNHLLWDDDEEYEELSDYVKENYYVVGKYGNGKFVRIPKGRTLAVIQNGFEQVSNALTGDDEADFGRFFELFLSNLAPNNPLDNNIIAPIKQVVENKTWYGEDLVPSRLQDLPAAEQYDESTDAISKWLGEKTNTSPYKINYLLNQYSGGVGDIVLPMLTPEAERGDNSLLGNAIAPLKEKFTTDSVMNNQNVSDFYDTVDVLTTNTKSSYATDEDILKSKYINSVNSELSDLYKSKREIQNSNLSDSVKYEQVRNIQEQINNLAKNALNSYENVDIQDGYATVGDKHYRLDDGTWTKISAKQLERQQQVTSELGISPAEYWSKTDISYFPNSDGEYEYAYNYPEKYAVSKAVGGYSAYKTYSSELYNIKADKDENGKSITGSRKEKVIEYINNLDADYETKIILFKSEYPSDDTYNMDIVNYLNEREDLTYEERVTILTELGFTVTDDGSIYW